jgi:hypothetical protein
MALLKKISKTKKIWLRLEKEKWLLGDVNTYWGQMEDLEFYLD